MANRDDGGGWVYLLAGTGALSLAVYRASVAAVGRWHDPVRTVAVRFCENHLPAPASELAARLMAHAAAPFESYSGLFAAAASAVLAYPLVRSHFGTYVEWPAPVRLTGFVWTAVSAVLVVLTVPLAWPLTASAAALALAAANAFAALLLMFSMSEHFYQGDKKLEQGPTIAAPIAGAGSIHIGESEHRLLPELIRWLARRPQRISVPFTRLSNGMTILGEKGSGKSRMLFLVHDAIRRHYPSVPLLIHDPKGEWYRSYFTPTTDHYFAPHYEGSVKWDIIGDFVRIPELRHALLSSAISAHKTRGDNFWSDNATALLMEVFNIEATAGRPFSIYDAQKRFVSKIQKNAEDKTFQSIATSAKLAYLDIAKCALMGDPDAPGLSIDDFLKYPGRILLLNDPSCVEEQIGAFNLFLSAFLLRALSMPDIPAGQLRCVAVIDEALTFQLPEDVDRRIYAMCRSKGICVVAGAQRLPDVHQHERGEWQTSDYIFAMKVVNQETQQKLSKRAGQIVFKEKSKSHSSHQNSSGGSVSVSEHTSRQDVLPPEYFGRLSPREFVLFHDKGMIAGRTADSDSVQSERPFPRYTSLPSVINLSSELTEAASKAAKSGSRG